MSTEQQAAEVGDQHFTIDNPRWSSGVKISIPRRCLEEMLGLSENVTLLGADFEIKDGRVMLHFEFDKTTPDKIQDMISAAHERATAPTLPSPDASV